MLSSHSRRIGPQDALKKDSRGLSRVAAGNPRFPRLLQGTLATHYQSIAFCHNELLHKIEYSATDKVKNSIYINTVYFTDLEQKKLEYPSPIIHKKI